MKGSNLQQTLSIISKMDKQDYLMLSFHPDLYNVSWLEARFQVFCENKSKVDVKNTMRRLKHAPVHPKVVHKLLGRHSSTSKAFLHKDSQTFKQYLDLITHDTDPNPLEEPKHLLSRATVQCSALGDAKNLIKHLRGDQTIYTDILTLFELVNMTYFCKEEYMRNTDPSHIWIVHYICQLVDNITFHKTDHSFAHKARGLQTESLLKTVRATMLSVRLPTMIERPIFVSPAKIPHPPTSPLPETPLIDRYPAFHSDLKGRTLIGSLLTT